jgi:hypothetical protein
MKDIDDEHKCNICNKIYSSYKTLWTHNKIKHKTEINKCNVKVSEKYENSQLKIYKCKYCDNEYNHKQSRWSHQQKCKVIYEEKQQQKQLVEIKIAEINKEKEIELAKINKEIKLAEINLELKKVEIRKENSLIKKEQKSQETPTIKKINKMLQQRINMKNSNLISNSNNTNSNNIQNNIVHNHFNIEGFGKENILSTITDKEKKLILNQGHESIEKLIEIVYVGKYDQFKNVLVTNKRDNDIYTYDDKSELFINNDKNLVLNKLVANRLEDVEEIYNEFDENNKLSDSNRKIMSRFFIKFIDEDKKYIDESSNNKEYKNYLDFKVDKVNNILFNNQNKIIASIDACLKGDPSGL